MFSLKENVKFQLQKPFVNNNYPNGIWGLKLRRNFKFYQIFAANIMCKQDVSQSNMEVETMQKLKVSSIGILFRFLGT